MLDKPPIEFCFEYRHLMPQTSQTSTPAVPHSTILSLPDLIGRTLSAAVAAVQSRADIGGIDLAPAQLFGSLPQLMQACKKSPGTAPIPSQQSGDHDRMPLDQGSANASEKLALVDVLGLFAQIIQCFDHGVSIAWGRQFATQVP